MEHSSNPYPMDHWAQQSPIDLRTKETLFVPDLEGSLRLVYSGAPFAGMFEGEKDHENFVLSDQRIVPLPPCLKLGSVTARLIKIHLHTPSEHKLDGKTADGEIHLIHEIIKPTGGSTLVVLGVFFNERKTRCVKSDFFQAWTSQLMAMAKQPDSAASPEVFINPQYLVPNYENLTGPNKEKWYRYEGSLTSPQFDETVSWVVFPEPLGIRSKDLEELRKHAHQPERETQPINRRFVLRSFR